METKTEIKTVDVKGAEAAVPGAYQQTMGVEVDSPDPHSGSEPKTVSSTPTERQVGADRAVGGGDGGRDLTSAALKLDVDDDGGGHVIETEEESEKINGGDTVDRHDQEKVNKKEGSTFYQEKRILVNELERLRKVIVDLSERQSVLEDFIEMEYSDKFEKYLKKRDHLIGMGFGENDLDKDGNKTKTADGKRKSSELVELLKMTKEKDAANGSSSTTSTDTISKRPPPTEPPKPKASSSATSQSNSQHLDEVDVKMGKRKRKWSEASSVAANSSSVPKSVHPSLSVEGQPQPLVKNPLNMNWKEMPVFVFNESKIYPVINVQCPVPLCEKVMKKEDLLEHLLRQHQKHLRFKCRDCNKKFSLRHKLKAHMRNAHSTPHNEITQYVYDLVQSLCGAWLSQMWTSAMNSSEEQMDYQQEVQLESSQNQSDLTEMEDSTSETSQSCVSGSEGAGTVQGQGQPLVKNPLNPSWKTMPVLVFESKQHQNQNETRKRKRFRVCPVPPCGKVVKRKALRGHLVSHKGQESFPIKCRNCDEEFLLRSKVRVHMQEAHRAQKHDACAYVRNVVHTHFAPWLDEMCIIALIPSQKQMMQHQQEQREGNLERGQVQSDSSEIEDEDGTSETQSSASGPAI